MMIFGAPIALAVGIYFGVPLLPMLVAAALLQGVMAFAITRSPVVIQVTMPVAITALGTLLVLPMLIEYDSSGVPPSLLESLTWVTGAVAAAGLTFSTYFGMKGNAGSRGPTGQAKDIPTADSLATIQKNEEAHDKLSVGAHMQRGAPVNCAPGQAMGSALTRQAHASSPTGSMSTNQGTESKRPTSDEGDFSTSMLVGASTGSTMLGYAVGGSLSGAFVGSTLHHDSRSDDRPNSGFNSSCEASSDADSGVSSSEI